MEKPNHLSIRQENRLVLVATAIRPASSGASDALPGICAEGQHPSTCVDRLVLVCFPHAPRSEGKGARCVRKVPQRPVLLVTGVALW